jgi:hypothetical protein
MNYLIRATHHNESIVTGNYKLTLFGLEDIGIFTDYSVSTNHLTPPLKFVCGLAVVSGTKFNLRGINRITCYTSCKIYLENRCVTFCSTCNFGDDGYWYNWCLIEWVDNNEVRNTYTGKILGYFMMNDCVYAVIQVLSDPITMEQLIDQSICSFVLDDKAEVVYVETINERTIV